MNFQTTTKRIYTVIMIAVVTIGLVSCGSTKKLKYFNDLPDLPIVDLPPAPREERTIEYGDALDISFSGKDPAATAFFLRNAGGPTVTLGEPGYIVDPSGLIEIPQLGKLKVYGLTARRLKAILTDSAMSYIKDPIVDVKFITFKVTIIGEVRNPGSQNLSMQRTTILDALAAAGDLPITAKRSGIQLYRDYNGQRSITQIDLRKKEVLTNKDIFQLKHNDVLIVQPRPQAVFQQEFGLFTSLIGLVVSLIGLVVVFTK